MEGVDFEPHLRVMENLHIFYFSLFLFPLFPYAPLIAVTGLLLNYAVDKYILLRRCKRPDYLSGDLGFVILYIMAFGWMTYILGNLLFTFNFNTYANESYIKIFIVIFVTGCGLLMENLFTSSIILNLDMNDIYEENSSKDLDLEEEDLAGTGFAFTNWN